MGKKATKQARQAKQAWKALYAAEEKMLRSLEVMLNTVPEISEGFDLTAEDIEILPLTRIQKRGLRNE